MSTDDRKLTAYFREEAWLLSLAKSLVQDEATANDMVQEVWVAVCTNAPEDCREPRAWLRSVLKKRLAKHASKAARYVAGDFDQVESATERPETAVIKWEGKKLLTTAIDGLDAKDRLVILLRYQEDLPIKKIARRMRMSERGVKYRLQQAIERTKLRMHRLTGSHEWAIALIPLALAARDLRRAWHIGRGALIAALLGTGASLGALAYLYEPPAASNPTMLRALTARAAGAQRGAIEESRFVEARARQQASARAREEVPLDATLDAPAGEAPPDSNALDTPSPPGARAFVDLEVRVGGFPPAEGFEAWLVTPLVENRAPLSERVRLDALGRARLETDSDGEALIQMSTWTREASWSWAIERELKLEEGEQTVTIELLTGSLEVRGSAQPGLIARGTNGSETVQSWARVVEGVARFPIVLAANLELVAEDGSETVLGVVTVPAAAHAVLDLAAGSRPGAPPRALELDGGDGKRR